MQEKFIKYLGLLIDSHLSWKYHILHISKKIKGCIGILSKIRHSATDQVLLQLYYSLIYPFLTYSNLGEYISNNSFTSYHLTKKAVRIMTFSEYNFHSSPLLQKLKILKVTQYIYIVLYLCTTVTLIDCHWFLIISSRLSTKCINIKPDWRVRFHTICQKQGLITANLTFVFSVLKFGIPLLTHLNLRVMLVSKIS